MFYVKYVIIITVLLIQLPIQAQEKYGNWTYSLRIHMNTKVSGANISEDVYNFPLLVQLDTSWFDFSQAMSNGFDVRFSKADSKPLYFEREHWSVKDSKAEFWVLIDTVKGNDSIQYIKMYWGNDTASDLSNSEAVFDTANSFAGVWHLGEYSDATGNDNDGTQSGNVTDTNGMIGRAKRFDGDESAINVGSDNSLDNLAVITMAAWIYPEDWGGSDNGRILQKHDESNDGVIYFYISNSSNRKTVASQRYRSTTNTLCRCKNGSIKMNEWQHVVAVINGTNATQIFINGQEAEYERRINGSGSLTPDAGADLFIGNNQLSERSFDGILDEIRISSTTRSPHWIKLSYENQRRDQVLINYIPDSLETVLVPYPSPTFETKPVLRWYKPSFPITQYTVQVALDKSFTIPLVNTTVSDTFYACVNNLPIDTIYWRVKAADYIFSKIGTFIIHDGKIPTLIPHDDPTYIRRPSLQWYIPPVIPSTYTIQLANNQGFNPLLIDTIAFDTMYTCHTDLPLGKIFWRVRGDSSSFSAPDSFVILEGKIPILIAFEDPTYIRKPTLQWYQPPVLPNIFNIQIANNPAFNPNIIDTFSVDTFYNCQKDLPLGKIFWRVRGDSSSFSIPDSFVVLEGKTPILIPFEDTTLMRKPQLQWYSPIVAVSNFTIQISKRVNFDTLLVETTVTDTFYTCQQDLPLGPIYWRVRGDSSAYSAISSFVVIEDYIPVLIPYESPTYERKPTLTWHRPLIPVTKYTIQVSISPKFDPLFLNTFSADTFTTLLADLPIDTIYWRVKINDYSFSPPNSFIVLDPRVPMIIPFKPKVINYQTPILKWHKVDDSASYFFEADNNKDFTSPIISIPVSDTTFTPPSPFPLGEIYWHVKTTYINTWSQTDFFVIVADSIPMLVRYNGKTCHTLRPTFFWHPVAQSSHYNFTLADNIDFTNAIFTPLTDTSYALTSDLHLGTWYWKVSSSRNPELYAPVDSLIIDTSNTINPFELNGKRQRLVSVYPHALRICLNNYPPTIKVRAHVFSLNGRQVASLKIKGSKNKFIDWNYKNNHGRTVSAGIYIVTLEIDKAVHFYKVVVQR